jgi:hypothetical protein
MGSGLANRFGTPQDAWSGYVASLPWSHGQLDDSSWRAFLRAGSLSIDAGLALQEVVARIQAAGDHPRRGKLESQLRRAYQFAKAETPAADGRGRVHWAAPPRPPGRAFDRTAAARFADRVPPLEETWLVDRSPVDVRGVSPERFLAELFAAPDDKVLIFSRYRSQGQCVWQRGRSLEAFRRGHAEGVWFLSQPVDGHFHPNPRQGYPSRRSEESVSAWRYAVLECDCQPAAPWLRILVQMPLPIVSIVSSGGKSLHALVRVEAANKTRWDQIIRERLLPRVVPLGADPQALTAVRLTRLPGCYRGERLQALLYLDPGATGAPIWKGGAGGA